MLPFLAQQQLDNMDAAFWKNFSIAMLVILGIIVALVSIYAVFRKSEPVRLNDQPAIEVRKAPNRYNHDATTIRFAEVERRITQHDKELEAINRSREETLKRINGRFERIMVGIAIIGTKLGVKLPEAEDEDQY